MPASHDLHFSLSLHLIDICGSIVGVVDGAAERVDFRALISTSRQATHIAATSMKRALRDAVVCRRRWSTSEDKRPLVEPSVGRLSFVLWLVFWGRGPSDQNRST